MNTYSVEQSIREIVLNYFICIDIELIGPQIESMENKLKY